MDVTATIKKFGLEKAFDYLYKDPDKKLVVAVASYFKPTVFDRVDFIEDVLLPEM